MFIASIHLVSKAALWEERDELIKQRYDKINNENISKVAHVCPSSWAVYADKGYCVKPSRLAAARKNMHLVAIKKNNMRGKNRDLDRWITGIRSPYESVFSKQRRRFRYCGIAKNQFAEFMNAICFNMRRILVFEAPKGEAKAICSDIIQIERKTEQFFDRIIETDSPTLITAYENKIRKLEEEKIRLDENIAKCGRPLESFDDTFRTAMSFLSNPHKIWNSGKLEHQRMVLKLAFTEKLPYCKNNGF